MTNEVVSGNFGEYVHYSVFQSSNNGKFYVSINAKRLSDNAVSDTGPYDTLDDALENAREWAFEVYAKYIHRSMGDGMPINTLTIKQQIENLAGVVGVVVNQVVNPVEVAGKTYDAVSYIILFERQDAWHTLSVLAGDNISINDVFGGR